MEGTYVRVGKEYRDKLYELAFLLWRAGRIKKPRLKDALEHIVDSALREFA